MVIFVVVVVAVIKYLGHKQAKEERVDLDLQFQRVKTIINGWQDETDQSLRFWKQGDHILSPHTRSRERENIK